MSVQVAWKVYAGGRGPKVWVVEVQGLPHFSSEVLGVEIAVPDMDEASAMPWRVQDDLTVVLVRALGVSRLKAQKAWGDAARTAGKLSGGEIGVWLKGVPDEALPAAIYGIDDGLYRFRMPGSGGSQAAEPESGPRTLEVAGDPEASGRIAALQAVAGGRAAARDWVNTPSNLKPPETLAQMFRDGAPDSISWEVVGFKELKAMGAGGILAVGGGSVHPPCVLVGTYRGAGDAPFIALVGKGITFDSGGISIKPAQGMGNMKADMGGAAAVAGAIRTVAALALPVNVMAITPLAENLPDGNAFRPGDVLTMLDGTTVEIVSTDAEGRLVLGDGLTMALSRGAARVVDVATLTGANVIVLGGIRASLISHHPEFAEAVQAAGDRYGEGLWILPDDSDFMDLNKSGVAKIKNAAGRPAGTITAGLFVGHFAKDTPWAHLDIAGLAYQEKPSATGLGATGYAVATLVGVCDWWSKAARG